MTTVEVDSSPLVKTTLLFMAMASTRCPPVTLANDVFVNSVGMNIEALVKAEAGYDPFKT